MGHLLVLDLPAQTYKKNRDQPILGDLAIWIFQNALDSKGLWSPRRMSQRFSLRFVRKPVPQNVKCVNCVNQTKLRWFMMNHDNVTASRYIYILHYVFRCLHTIYVYIYIYMNRHNVYAYVYMVQLDIWVHCNDLTVMRPEKIVFFRAAAPKWPGQWITVVHKCEPYG